MTQLKTKTAKRLKYLKANINTTYAVSQTEIINFKNELKEIMNRYNYTEESEYIISDILKLIQEIEQVENDKRNLDKKITRNLVNK